MTENEWTNCTDKESVDLLAEHAKNENLIELLESRHDMVYGPINSSTPGVHASWHESKHASECKCAGLNAKIADLTNRVEALEQNADDTDIDTDTDEQIALYVDELKRHCSLIVSHISELRWLSMATALLLLAIFLK